MSAERRYDQRRFQLVSSTTQTPGAPTVFIEHMTPGTTVPPHWHSRFSETFELLSGSMQVYQTTQPHAEPADMDALEASAQDLQLGTPTTVKPEVYHKYLSGDGETTLRVTLTPGDRDFERLLMIMNGLAEDGELEKLGDSVVFMAVVMDLSDARMIGPAKAMLDGVRSEKAEEVRELKERLLRTYDNETQLARLLAE